MKVAAITIEGLPHAVEVSSTGAGVCHAAATGPTTQSTTRVAEGSSTGVHGAAVPAPTPRRHTSCAATGALASAHDAAVLGPTAPGSTRAAPDSST